MAEEYNISILEVINACVEFLQHPEDEEKVKALEDLKQKFVIKSYLALEQKRMAVKAILNDIQVSEEVTIDFGVALEMSLKFNGLLLYTNIFGGEDSVLHETEVYDILQECGIWDEIEQYAGKDFSRLEGMVKDGINIGNIKNLLEAVEGMNGDKVKELIDEVRDFKMKIDPKAIIALGDIAAENDPILHQLKEGVEKAAYEAANSVQKQAEKENTETTEQPKN